MVGDSAYLGWVVEMFHIDMTTGLIVYYETTSL